MPKLVILFFLTAFCLSVSSAQLPLAGFRLELEYTTLNDQGEVEERVSEFSADSGSISVAENRRNPRSRQISLPFIRIRATGESPGSPVFWLSGGPGQTNLRSFQYDYFLRNHDHVMVGYRGVDGSVSLDCPEVTRALEDGGDILSPEMIQEVSSAFGVCWERLVASGVDINGYTPMDVVEDMEEVRKGLGYESVTILSESYGTRVAYLYALKYPDRVQRMIMIGANPPGRMVWDSRQYDSLLVRYGELWKRNATASKRYPDLVEALRKVSHDMPKRWLFFPIHEGTVKASTNAFLFHRGTAAQVFDAYCAAADGDPSGLWLFSFIGSGIFPTVVNWGDNASKAVSADYDSTRNYVSELMNPEAITGAALGAFLWAPAQSGSWPIAPIPQEFRRARLCRVETLFLSGSLDFSTPASNVETDLLPNFPNGHHVVLAEAGHVFDLWQSQPAATHRLLTAFLDRGVVDTSQVRYLPMSFEVSWGFPFLAKAVVGAGSVVILLAVWGGWKVGRKIKDQISKRRNNGM